MLGHLYELPSEVCCPVCGHDQHPAQRLLTSMGPRTSVGAVCYGCPECMAPTHKPVGWRGV